ncbi:hypothetical protein PXK30_20360 [Phaeobacter gallaeciensis]|jgi:hypothetical protein|uniref:hypothetical protein n=1 Tax=Rhodobacterales TaxID=204455 RepID=UPI00237F8B9C|nr:hypothetical protein [Phaeobacter gallaeciensis]MDE4193206.1 hypothetical protein [Phaeobacter gallaeciensis]MDE4201519.1 hypothetical protein [Phaeobacter gallaeciensis]MDE4205703.1 hypothetical protein [Phaeobacter gallaeciensis]MDE4209842.1 hypothetical protein [Phaeobacter gallaeciensis]MDE4218210.1 hypothetical protein [Phaeobacter gallaeciensis]
MLLLRRLIWALLLVCLGVTALPYLGFFAAPDFIGPFPQALALVLGANVVLTLCVIALYPLCFRPLQAKLDANPIEEA